MRGFQVLEMGEISHYLFFTNFLPLTSLHGKLFTNRSVHLSQTFSIIPKHIFLKLADLRQFNHKIFGMCIAKIRIIFNVFEIFPSKSMIPLAPKDQFLTLNNTPFGTNIPQTMILYPKYLRLKSLME